jgi:hypothetical protein
VVVNGAAICIQFIRHRSRANTFRKLAGEWKMRYSKRDLFHLAQRIARQFPAPGVSDLRVLDLIYASEGNRHRYLFTIEYTTSQADQFRREQRAGTFADSAESVAKDTPIHLQLGPAGVPINAQYEHLHKQWLQAPNSSTAGPAHSAKPTSADSIIVSQAAKQ